MRFLNTLPGYVITFAVLMLMTARAEAAESNIALSEYPGPKCNRPELPVQPQLPPDENVVGAAFAYNLKIKRYNQAIADYNVAVTEFGGCMQTYVENGNADIMRIKQRLDQSAVATNLQHIAVTGGSNIALSEYPVPQCSRPDRPVATLPQPPDVYSGAAVASFNHNLREYNQLFNGYNAAVAAFNGCMHTYIENGNADMARIKKRLDEAVAMANAH